MCVITFIEAYVGLGLVLVYHFSLWYTMAVLPEHNRLWHSGCYSLGCYERRVTSRAFPRV